VNTSQAKPSHLARLTSWLEQPYDRRRMLLLMAVVVVADLTYSLLAVLGVYAFGGSLPASAGEDLLSGRYGFLELALLLVGVVILEEVLFRLVPLGLARLFRASPRVMVLIAILSSIGFGLAHGSWTSILIQGVSGLCLSLIYLKAGGLSGRVIRGFDWSCGAHLCFNALVFAVALATG
jgi:membrane protease YdiL (CAAX protease family)